MSAGVAGVITHTDQLSADWLSTVLARAGALRAGRIAEFTAEGSASTNGHTARIRLSYSQDAVGHLPLSLFLKIYAAGSMFSSPSEINYYARDYVGLADAPIPICYDAQYSAESGTYHILAEDLSKTHAHNFERTPTPEYGLALADGLAALHAHWWGADRLREGGFVIPDEAAIRRYLDNSLLGLKPMLEAAGDEIPASWADTLIDIFEWHPLLMIERAKQAAERPGFALVHGDVNPGNILSPTNGIGKLYIIDRQPFDWSLTTWLGVYDVSYAMVHWWEPALRREYELPVLRRYHERLQARGVHDYTWDALYSDYKLAAVQSLYVAANWCIDPTERTTMRWVWMPQLKKAMAAYFDLYRPNS